MITDEEGDHGDDEHKRKRRKKKTTTVLITSSSTPGELAALLKRDTERWAPLVKTIGFTAES